MDAEDTRPDARAGQLATETRLIGALTPASFAAVLLALLLPFLTMTAVGCDSSDPLMTATGVQIVRGQPGSHHPTRDWAIPPPSDADYNRHLSTAAILLGAVAALGVAGMIAGVLWPTVPRLPVWLAVGTTLLLCAVLPSAGFSWAPDASMGGPTLHIEAEPGAGWYLALLAAIAAAATHMSGIRPGGNAERSPIAGRLVAGVLDLVIVSSAAWAAEAAIHAATDMPRGKTYAISWVVLGSIYWIGLDRSLGTPGKRALRLRLVTIDGDRVGIARATARFAARILVLATILASMLTSSSTPMLVLLAATVLPLILPTRLAVHDAMAGTRVARCPPAAPASAGS